MDKTTEINYGIDRIREIMAYLNPVKAGKWSIQYLRMTADTLKNFDAWNIKYYGLFDGEEYIIISDEFTILYVINVSANSTLYTLRELFDLLSEKY